MEYYFPALSDGSNHSSSSSSAITNTNTNTNTDTNNIDVSDNRRNKERVNHRGPLGHEQKSKNKVKLSTDPQSVAARERRHRISERFKTLQSLVPGGTKMDTVSMLEEAIHYVKFLKNQIWLHQTMINFGADDEPQYYDHDPSFDTVFQLPVHHGYPVGSVTLEDAPRLQQALCYGQNDHFIGSSSVQPPIPSMPEYPCFQDQEDMLNMDAYVKYYS